MDDGWDASARAWIDGIETHGDWSRRSVLDRPMLDRIADRGFKRALDIGCGEGRFCRMMQACGIKTTGIDPTIALIEQARRLDPNGDYRIARAEALDLPDDSVDLAVSYLSLIDIPDLPGTISEAYRVLRPGGTLLIANLQSFNTAGDPKGWIRMADGSERFAIDRYLDERSQWMSWSGVRIRNWHRPLSTYMRELLGAGFALCHFAEPEPIGELDERATRYRRAPWFLIIEWRK